MSNLLLARSFTAGANILANRLVMFSAAETVTHSSNAGPVIGVCMDVAPVSGERVDVIVAGIALVEAAGVIARGALVMSDGFGRAQTAATTAGNNVRVVGEALEDAAAAGDLIRVLLSPGSLQG